MRSNFIQRRQDDSSSEFRVDDSSVKSIHEFSLIHLLAEVSSIVEGSLPGLAVHEDIEKHQSLLTVAWVKKRKPVMLLKEAVVGELIYKVLGSGTSIGVDGLVGNRVEASSCSLEVIEAQGLSHMIQQMVHRLLPHSNGGSCENKKFMKNAVWIPELNFIEFEKLKIYLPMT